MGDKAAERSLEQITGRHRGLGRLLERARDFDRLDREIQAQLPDSMRGRIRVACIEDDCLVLAAAGPAWASRARLMADELLNETNRHLPKPLSRTRVVVVPTMTEADPSNP